MKKLVRIILILLVVVNAVLFVLKYKANKELDEINKTINDCEKVIYENNESIKQLQEQCDDLKDNSGLLEKEYEIWVHQNEKLVELLH